MTPIFKWSFKQKSYYKPWIFNFIIRKITEFYWSSLLYWLFRIIPFCWLLQLLSSTINIFNTVSQSCPTLCDPTNHSTPGLPVHHQLLEFTQTYVHRVYDAIQPSHPLWSPSPPALNLSQHQSLFKWVNSLNEVAKELEFQLQHQSFQWTPRTDLLGGDWLDLLAVQGTLKSLLQHHSSKTSILRRSAFFTVQHSHPYMTTGKP